MYVYGPHPLRLRLIPIIKSAYSFRVAAIYPVHETKLVYPKFVFCIYIFYRNFGLKFRICLWTCVSRKNGIFLFGFKYLLE